MTDMAISDLPLPPHFSSDREIHVVVSVLSGHCKAQEYYDSTLKPFLDSRGLSYKTHTTKSAQTIVELTRDLFKFNACKGVKQTIILLSGDGGVIDIVNTLAVDLQRDADDPRRPSIFVKPVICLIPMGTANALAWSSGCAADPLTTMLTGQAHSVPMFEAKFSAGARLVTNEAQDREVITGPGDGPTVYGAVVASWGLHASLVAMSDTKEYRRHGLERFRVAAEVLLKEGHRYRGTVKILPSSGEWKTLYADDSERAYSYVLATLVSGLEEKFKISPATQPLDGKMRVVAFKPHPSEEVMRLLTLAYQQGKHVEEAAVTYEEIERIRVEVDEDEERWRQVCIDGKIVALEPGGWMEVKMLPALGVDGRRVIELVC